MSEATKPMARLCKGGLQFSRSAFGSVVGFVAGYFGELSKGAHEVLAMAAEEIAERAWIEAGATSLDHAKSIQKQHTKQ